MNSNEVVRFIHTADIHLGSLLHIGSEPIKQIEDQLIEAVYNSFERLCNVAIKESVDFILISGDLFDSQSPSLKAYNFFIEMCNKLRRFNIDIYLSFGNHDSGNRLQQLFAIPENLHIFNVDYPSVFKIYKGQRVIANIIGQSYAGTRESRQLHRNFNNELSALEEINIAMLHTQLEATNKNYAPCTLNELFENKEIDYWALGHIHKNRVFKDSGRYAVYSGIPQGRDFGEEGLGIAYLVEIDNKKTIKLQDIPLSQVIYKRIELSIEQEEMHDIENISDFKSYILDKIKNIDKEERSRLNLDFLSGFIFNIDIVGMGKLHDVLNVVNDDEKSYFIDNLNKELVHKENILLIDAINFITSKEIPKLEELKETREIFKELFEVIEDCKVDNKLKPNLIKNWGNVWEEVKDGDNMNFEKIQIDEEIFNKIIEKAANYVCEKLLVE